jgi:hypothetical protein
MGALLAVLVLLPSVLRGQAVVDFPPAEGKPPPAAKSPPRTQTSGEDTGIIPDYGPTMRKTQQRTPPPPTNLTVMYKLEYGTKLQYVHPDGTVQVFEQWKSFPADGQGLISQSNHRLADGMNYQYATKALASSGFDPLDIPLLYMAGDYEFRFTDQEVLNLREFLREGGTILFNAARGRDEFNRTVVREMRRVFPNKTFMKVAGDHPILNARYRIGQVMALVNGVQVMVPPNVYTLDIGARSAAILLPWGAGAAWSGEKEYHPAGRHLVGESAIRLGTNIVAYVLGITEYGRFLAQEFPLYSGTTRAGDVFRFALARYNGSWDDYPAIQNAVITTLEQNTGIPVDYDPVVVDLDDPLLGANPLVFMTGHHDFELTEKEVANLREYLERGGILFTSAASGFKAFDMAVRRELARVLPDAPFVRLPPSHPLFTRGWTSIETIEYTEAAVRDEPLLDTPRFEAVMVDGRMAVLHTPWDLLGGVNDEPNAYRKGVLPDDARRLLINLVTWSLTH